MTVIILSSGLNTTHSEALFDEGDDDEEDEESLVSELDNSEVEACTEGPKVMNNAEIAIATITRIRFIFVWTIM